MKSRNCWDKAWFIILYCYYSYYKARALQKCPQVLGTVLTEALHFLSAVSLQVRLDGDEGHRMAGSEISSDGECQEGWRAYQRGTSSPTSRVTWATWVVPFEQRTSLHSGDHAKMNPRLDGLQEFSFSGTICNPNLKQRYFPTTNSSTVKELKALDTRGASY